MWHLPGRNHLEGVISEYTSDFYLSWLTVVFRSEDEIFCTGIGEQVYPFVGIPRRCKEVCDEIVIYDV